MPNVFGLGADGVENFQVCNTETAIGSILTMVLSYQGRSCGFNDRQCQHREQPRALPCIERRWLELRCAQNFHNHISASFRRELTLLSRSGIVTQLDIITYPLVKIQYTINLYDRSDYLNIINATVQVQQAMETDPKIGLFTNFHSAFVAVGLLYGDWSEEKPKAFDPFTNLTSLMTTVAPTTNGTFSSLAGAMAHLAEPQKYLIFTADAPVYIGADDYTGEASAP